MDKAHSSVVDETEVRDLKVAFGLLDTNKDGKVNASEMSEMLKSLGLTLSEEQVEVLISQASTSGDGLISEKEFLDWMASHAAHFTSESGQDDVMEDFLAAFRVFDKDGNGYITRDELKIAMEMIGEPMSDALIDQMIKAADIDNDGQINYEEFARILL